MKVKQITFTAPGVAELWEVDGPDAPGRGEVLVKTAYTAVSAGTERANLMGEYRTNINEKYCGLPFPKVLGYSSAGEVVAVGEGVKSVKVGDRVQMFWTTHRSYLCKSEDQVVKIPDGVSYKEATMAFIASFALAGVRKTAMEFGKSALVVGLGLLGQYAVQVCRASGAVPVIAADLRADRRETALKMGADYALNPADPDFVEQVLALTDGEGAQSVVEVTGAGAAMVPALKCCARFGYLSLLGCTRQPVDNIDFYSLVHGRGINIVGAHTCARPETESHHNYWTHRDDCRALMEMTARGRFDLGGIVSEEHSPEDCGAVYARLASDPATFPLGVVFRW